MIVINVSECLAWCRALPGAIWEVICHPSQLLQGIEFNPVVMIEVAFVAIVLSIAGYFSWQYWAVKPVEPVAALFIERSIALDPSLPVSDRNPLKKYTVAQFSINDGRLDITWPTNSTDPTVRKVIAFTPDNRKKTFLHYQDDWARIQAVKDPTRRGLMMAGYMVAFGHWPTVYSDADLTIDQSQKERAARKALRDEVDATKVAVASGEFAEDSYQKAMAALEAYRNLLATEPNADQSKKDAAMTLVVQYSTEYLEKIDKARQAAVSKYVEAVLAMLEAKQRESIDKAGQDLAQKVRPNSPDRLADLWLPARPAPRAGTRPAPRPAPATRAGG